MKKKYVLFDFDGVIADTEESNSHYLGLALKEFGVELTEKDKQRLIGTHDQELLIEFLSRAPRKVTVEQLTRRRKELGNTYENGNIAPIPGIVPLIQGLRQSGVKTALVSSTATRLIIMGLNRMQMTDLFDVIVCGDMNVAHNEIDLKNPKSNRGNAGFTDEERQKFTVLLESGFADSFRMLYPDRADAYTWWSYMFKARERNTGWRIDYFLVSARLIPSVKDAFIRPDVMGSDHCPVGLLLETQRQG